MTYHAYFSDNLLLSQRLFTAFGMYFWLTVFLICVSLIFYFIKRLSIPDNRRF